MHFFTHIAGDSSQAKYFMQSVVKNNINLTILNEIEYTHHARKLVLLQEAMKHISDDSIIVFTDAFDVLYLQPENVIREKFFKFGVKLLFNAQRSEDSDSVRYDKTHRDFFKKEAKSKYCYLNTGAFMGYKGAVVKMLNWCVKEERFDESKEWCKAHGIGDSFISDQHIIADYAMLHPEEVSLDCWCEIFWNTCYDWGRFNKLHTMKDGVLYHAQTGTDPCILHVPFVDKRKYYVRMAKNLLSTPGRI